MRETPISDCEARELYNEYWQSMSKEDAALRAMIFDNECYFDDMCLEKSSIVQDFIKYEYEEDGEVFEEYTEYYIDLNSRSWRFYVEKLEEGTAAITYCNERKIVFDEEYKEDLPTILHEMIHAHEVTLKELYPFYYEIVMISLYRKLQKEIPNLDDMILSHTHEYFGTQITLMGGYHGVLFFLKSLDLDLRLGFKLGTVCGYGREEYIEE